MENDIIREIQHYLRTLSFSDARLPPVVVDGRYGFQTETAVKTFQSINNLSANGQVDSPTWERLVTAYSRLQNVPIPIVLLSGASATMNKDTSSDDIRILQAILRTISQQYSNIPAPDVSGQYDFMTQNSIKSLQDIQNLPTTGIVDFETWNVIAQLYNTRFER